MTDEVLLSLLSVGGRCPLCDCDRPKYKEAVSDYPGCETYRLICPRCGLVAMWEERTPHDAQGTRRLLVDRTMLRRW